MAASKNGSNEYRYDFSEVVDLGTFEDLSEQMKEIKGLREAMAQFTVSWPFTHLDPRNPDDYRKLGIRSENGKPSEWMEAKQKFLDAFGSFLGAAPQTAG